jgi:hypothetical protein
MDDMDDVLTEVVELRVRVVVNVQRALDYMTDFDASNLATLVRNEIVSNLEDLKYIKNAEADVLQEQ